mgnify:CR=1 FL=1
MDMKRILQAIDGASTMPVEGASDMKKFLSVVSEADLNQPAALPAAPKFSITQTSYDSLNEPPDFTVTNIERGVEVASFGSEEEARAYVAQQDPAGAQQTELHQMQSKATAPEANPDAAPQQALVAEEVGMSRLLSIINEGANPHKVALPVQMAMQHYQKPVENTVNHKPSLLEKYFAEVEAELEEEKTAKRQLINQYASIIAERVRLKENFNPNLSPNPGFKPGPGGPGLQSNVAETPIELDVANPMASTVHSHNKANPGSIEYRIMRARKQLKDLAQQADSTDPLVWQRISRLFPELQMNIEQVAHGLEQLAKERRKGGVRSKNIPAGLDETFDTPKKIKPKKKTSTCRAGQVQTGMQVKDGKSVPKCSVR